ncbi:MAG: hypothetical protein ACFCGT_14140 [Sandaracinaceae bacterium]
MKPMNLMDGRPAARGATDQRALRILAKSVFRELKTHGYDRSDILSFTTEMLSLVSHDMSGATTD